VYVCVYSTGENVCILYSSLSPCVSVLKFWRYTSKLENFPLDFCRNYHIWGFASVLLTEYLDLFRYKEFRFYKISMRKHRGLSSVPLLYLWSVSFSTPQIWWPYSTQPTYQKFQFEIWLLSGECCGEKRRNQNAWRVCYALGMVLDTSHALFGISLTTCL